MANKKGTRLDYDFLDLKDREGRTLYHTIIIMPMPEDEVTLERLDQEHTQLSAEWLALYNDGKHEDANEVQERINQNVYKRLALMVSDETNFTQSLDDQPIGVPSDGESYWRNVPSLVRGSIFAASRSTKEALVEKARAAGGRGSPFTRR